METCPGRLFALVVLSVALCGCTEERPEGGAAPESSEQAVEVPPPLEHFEKVVAGFRAGRLAVAYSDYFPARYDEDLNRLLGKLKALVAEEDFTRLRSFCSKLADRVVPALKLRAEADPGLARLAEHLDDPLVALGLESYASFQTAGVRGWLERLEKGGARGVAEE